MSVAVCIACGGQKHGALAPCGRCGFEPSSPIDKAKSCMLTNLQLSTEEFAKVEAMIRTGQPANYDSVSLASLYMRFLDEDYLLANTDPTTGDIPCKRCTKFFLPEVDEVYCPPCLAEVEPVLLPCSSCQMLYESNAKFCQKCGAAVSPIPDLTTKRIGWTMALSVRRAVKLRKPLEGSQNLMAFRRELNDAQRITSEVELEIIGMYIDMVTLSNHMQSKRLLGECVRDMVHIYRESLILEGASIEAADSAVSLCSDRFHEYDEALAVDPERWMLHLGSAASMNCVGVKKHIGAVLEMGVVIGYFAKAFEATLLSVAFRT